MTEPRPARWSANSAPSRVGFAFGLLNALAVPGPILIPLLGHLGTAEPAARQLISRLAAVGDLEVERHGRVAVYALAGSMLRRYQTINDPPQPLRWEGSFEAVIHDIPQTHRRTRERLLSTAAREGFGQYRPGLLLGCRDPRRWLAGVLAEQADEAQASARSSPEDAAALDDRVEVGRLAVELDVARRMAAVVWDYAGLRERVDAAVRQLNLLVAEDGGDGWGHARRLHDAVITATPLWLTCADIPDELFPVDVALERTGELVGRIAQVANPRFQATVGEFLESSPHGHLVRGDPDHHKPPSTDRRGKRRLPPSA